MKYDVFVFAIFFTVADTLINDSCHGTKKSKIMKVPPTKYNVNEGSSAIFQWRHCNIPTASITGIIIFRRLAGQRLSYLVALGVTGKPVFSQTSHQYLYNITWRQKDGSITFEIKKTSLGDAGYYILEIRRVAYADLQNRVNLIVHKAVSPSLTTLMTYPLVTITTTSDHVTPMTKHPSIYTTSRVSPNISLLVIHPLTITISKTSGDNHISMTKHPFLNNTSSTEISYMRYSSHNGPYNMVPETKRQEIRLSKVNNNLRVSKKHTIKEKKEEFVTIEIILLCILAGLAPIALLSLVFAFYKLRGRRKKRTKRHMTPSSIEIDERNSMMPQRGGINRDELDDNFSASSLSGFSYRDSLEHDDSSDQELPSTITFGITQSMASALQSDVNFSPIITQDVKQDVNSPLLPERKNFELERELIRDMEIVGHGAFGLVAKAKLFHHNGLQTVAIKMLKDFASNEDRRDLIGECNLMKRLDPHRNVVQLLGYVLRTEPIWVVTEYVAHGDLLGFLRRSRGIQDIVYHGVATYGGSSFTQHQLLKMANDIACGMAHLARNKIIHRDLAARNVLVDENMNCKITDFGMARDVKSTNYYRTKSRGRIPFKWTAIEAILYDKYTTMSDVWSYAVVLYEIVTIGGSPYSRFGPREILRRLKRGWRMEKPNHVSNELYSVMLMCWAENPLERPSFVGLSEIFGSILGNQNGYINMEEYKYHLYDTVDDGSANSTSSEASPTI